MSGISRKEFFAGCIMAGFWANSATSKAGEKDDVVNMVFDWASALSEKFAVEEDKSRRALKKIQDEFQWEAEE